MTKVEKETMIATLIKSYKTYKRTGKETDWTAWDAIFSLCRSMKIPTEELLDAQLMS